MALWVKICGVTRVQDAQAAFEAGADAVGINLWPGSKRYCEPSRARDLVAALGPGRLVFGVFVRESRRRIEELVREVGLAGVQLHGGEPVDEARGWSLPVIRAVQATSRDAVAQALAGVEQAEPMEQAASPARHAPSDRAARDFSGSAAWRLLVDHASGGGTGKAVEASLLEGLDLSQAILAGGLTPSNVAATVRRSRPFGVDTAGGVESAPGIKDPVAIKAFVQAAREAAS